MTTMMNDDDDDVHFDINNKSHDDNDNECDKYDNVIIIASLIHDNQPHKWKGED